MILSKYIIWDISNLAYLKKNYIYSSINFKVAHIYQIIWLIQRCLVNRLKPTHSPFKKAKPS